MKRLWSLLAVSLLACSNDVSTEAAAAWQSALQSAIWTPIQAPPDAIARAESVFVYDDARENCVVFGGRPVDNRGRSLEDTGLWSRGTWVPVAAQYGRRGYVTGAFDSQRMRTVVYGGMDGWVRFADTWEFDGSEWIRSEPRSASSPSPGRRSANGLAYDARRGATVLFGGYDGSSWKDDLWEWDGSTWTQRCAAQPCSVAPRPAARARAVFVYDRARGVTLLFGGSEGRRSYADTWSWDGERWEELRPAHVPMGRDSAAATYDPVSERTVMFGGLAAGQQELNDFWTWDGTDWTSVSQTSAPFARHGAGMAWDAKRQRGILFAGSASGVATDAWEFNLLGTSCSTSSECQSGTCIQGSCSTAPVGVASGGAAGGGRPGNSAVDGGSSNGGVSIRSRGGATNGGTPGHRGGTATVPERTRADRSFYSCALSATSRSTRAPRPSIALLAFFATWFIRRRSAVSPARAT